MSDPSKVLDEIERLANAASYKKSRLHDDIPGCIVRDWGSSFNAGIQRDADFIAAANPETVMAFVEVARAALEMYPHARMGRLSDALEKLTNPHRKPGTTGEPG